MRDQLIGYLLEALEPEEHALVESRLSLDPHLKRELEILARALDPLALDRGDYEPPAGLAHRTCEFVAVQVATLTAPPVPTASSNRWSMADLLMAASIFFAATMLFFPALNQSRFAARLASCQNNLRQIGAGLTHYSSLHGGFFPGVPTDGNTATAGVYAATLMENGFLESPNVVVCPGSPLAEEAGKFRVPTTKELNSAQGPTLIRLRQNAGGSYGYSLGYVKDGKYQPLKNLHRANFALMADAPTTDSRHHHSANHSGCGQNVLFEDMHVQYLTTCKARGCKDNIFLNDAGQVAPGLHVNDSVIVASDVQPRITHIRIHLVPREKKQ